jgi:hypothetical protein
MKIVRSHYSVREVLAFTLVEVMIATTIFFMCLFALLGVLSGGIHAATILRTSGPTAGMVAGYFATSNKLEPGNYSGDFQDIAGYEGYTWKADADLLTNDLYKMNVVVVDKNGNIASFLNDLRFYKPGSSQGQRLGVQPQMQPR